MPEPVRTSITGGPPQDGIADEVGQVLGDAAVRVGPRVEDRDLQAACPVTGQEAAGDLCGLLPGEAAGVAVVHGWHQGVIENIDVGMHPESLKVRLGEGGQRLLKSTAGACLPDPGEVNDVMAVPRMCSPGKWPLSSRDPVAGERDILVPD
jgi:hypothetical protein